MNTTTEPLSLSPSLSPLPTRQPQPSAPSIFQIPQVQDGVFNHAHLSLSNLACCALVNRTWNSMVTPFLYEEIQLVKRSYTRNTKPLPIMSNSTALSHARWIRILETNQGDLINSLALTTTDCKLLIGLHHHVGDQDQMSSQLGGLIERNPRLESFMIRSNWISRWRFSLFGNGFLKWKGLKRLSMYNLLLDGLVLNQVLDHHRQSLRVLKVDGCVYKRGVFSGLKNRLTGLKKLTWSDTDLSDDASINSGDENDNENSGQAEEGIEEVGGEDHEVSISKRAQGFYDLVLSTTNLEYLSLRVEYLEIAKFLPELLISSLTHLTLLKLKFWSATHDDQDLARILNAVPSLQVLELHLATFGQLSRLALASWKPIATLTSLTLVECCGITSHSLQTVLSSCRQLVVLRVEGPATIDASDMVLKNWAETLEELTVSINIGEEAFDGSVDGRVRTRAEFRVVCEQLSKLKKLNQLALYAWIEAPELTWDDQPDEVMCCWDLLRDCPMMDLDLQWNMPTRVINEVQRQSKLMWPDAELYFEQVLARRQ